MTKRYRPRHAAGRGASKLLFLIAGTVLCAFTIGNLLVGNRNLGVWMPAIVGAPLLIYGIFKPALDQWFRTRAGARVRLIVIIFYIIVLAVMLIACGFMLHAASARPAGGADAVVVLGAGVHGDEVTDTLRKRLDAAVAYYAENPDTLLVVTGGMGSGESVPEAEAMRRYLLEQGIPEAAILKESEATNTRENFENTKKLLDERFGESCSIIYVTSDFHVYRAGQQAARAGFTDVRGLAVPTPVLTVPGSYMRECAAIWAGWLLGQFPA